MRDHRGAGSNVDQARSCASFLQPTHQHCDVRSLTAAVGVELVKHQKPQSSARPIQESLVFRPHQQQLRHHVIGQQNLWRAPAHFLALRISRFPSIFSEGYGKGHAHPTLVLFFQILESLILRVHQSIHRIDHQRSHAILGVRLADEAIHDGQEVAKALA